MTLYEGTSQIQKLIIGRALTGSPPSEPSHPNGRLSTGLSTGADVPGAAAVDAVHHE